MAEQEKQEQTDIVKAEAQEETALTQQGSEPSPAMILQRAVDSGASPEAVEKLVELYERLEARQAKKAFNEAMSAFQEECPVIEKQKDVRNSKKKGGGLRYKYAPLDDIVKQVREPLRKCGLSYTIDTVVEEGWVTSKCKVTHVLGHSETTEFKVPIDWDAYMNDQQKYASAQTFSKRYAFCNSLGILTGDEDDDGRGAGNPEPPRQTPQNAPQRNQRQRQPNTQPPSGNGSDGGNGPPSDKMKARFHAMGTELYGNAWDTKRPEIAQAYIKAKRGEAGLKSSNDLTKDEMSALMNKMDRKLDQINNLEFKEGTGETDDEGFMHICTVYDGGEAYHVSARGEEAEPKCSCPAGYQGDKPEEKWCIHIREAKKWCEQHVNSKPNKGESNE